jgi:hypothetical protein
MQRRSLFSARAQFLAFNRASEKSPSGLVGLLCLFFVSSKFFSVLIFWK